MTVLEHPNVRSTPAAVEEDAADVVAAASGSRSAFDRLVLRHQQAVVDAAAYYLGDVEDALEVSQEAFIRAYRGLRRFRRDATFRTWLLRITMNTARSYHQRRVARKRSDGRACLSLTPPSDGHAPPEIPDTSSAPETVLLRKEVKEAIEDAILELEPEARELVVLRDILGESYEAISRGVDLPLGTVKSRIHRARLQLRSRLEPLL